MLSAVFAITLLFGNALMAEKWQNNDKGIYEQIVKIMNEHNSEYNYPALHRKFKVFFKDISSKDDFEVKEPAEMLDLFTKEILLELASNAQIWGQNKLPKLDNADIKRLLGPLNLNEMMIFYPSLEYDAIDSDIIGKNVFSDKTTPLSFFSDKLEKTLKELHYKKNKELTKAVELVHKEAKDIERYVKEKNKEEEEAGRIYQGRKESLEEASVVLLEYNASNDNDWGKITKVLKK